VCKCERCTCEFSSFLRRLSFVMDCVNLENYPGPCSICVVPQKYVSQHDLLTDDVVMVRFMVHSDGCEVTSTHLGWIEEDNTFKRYNHQAYHGPPPLIDVNVLHMHSEYEVRTGVRSFLHHIIHMWWKYSVQQKRAHARRHHAMGRTGSRKRRV